MKWFDSLLRKNPAFTVRNNFVQHEDEKMKKLYEYLELNRPSKIIYISFFQDMLHFYPSQENVHSYFAEDVISGNQDEELKQLFLHYSCEVVLAQHHPLYSAELQLHEKIKNLSGKEHVFTVFVSFTDLVFLNSKQSDLKISHLQLMQTLTENSIDKSKWNALLTEIMKENDKSVRNNPLAESLQEWFDKVTWNN